jgi:hypothetical protein
MMRMCLTSGTILFKKSITASLASPIGGTLRLACAPFAGDTRSAILTLSRTLAI